LSEFEIFIWGFPIAACSNLVVIARRNDEAIPTTNRNVSKARGKGSRFMFQVLTLTHKKEKLTLRCGLSATIANPADAFIPLTSKKNNSKKPIFDL